MSGPYPVACGQPQEDHLPGNIEAALRFVQHAQSIEWGPVGHGMPGDAPKEHPGRMLSSAEKRAYDAALACLTEYFNSDVSTEVVPPQKPAGPDDPKEKVPAA